MQRQQQQQQKSPPILFGHVWEVRLESILRDTKPLGFFGFSDRTRGTQQLGPRIKVLSM